MTDTESRIRAASERYTTLRRVLAETERAIPTLQEQNRFVKDLDGQIFQTINHLKALDKKRTSELKDHEKYRDSSVRRYLYKATGKSDKFAEKAEKEEKEYYAVLQDLQQAKTLKEGLEAQKSDAMRVKSNLEAEVSRNNSAKAELSRLYEGIFAGPSPSFPAEDIKEEAVNQALAIFHQAQSQLENSNQISNLLSHAMQCINRAQAHIQYALQHSRMDMFGGGGFNDMMERQQLMQAEQMVQASRMEVNRARQLDPSIPNMPAININHGSIISDVLFDNIFTDMAFHQEIQRGQMEVARYERALGQQVGQAKGRQERLQLDVRRKEADLAMKREDLQREREAAFERFVDRGDVVRGDEPPAYEASPAGGSQVPPARTAQGSVAESGAASGDAPPPFEARKTGTNPFE